MGESGADDEHLDGGCPAADLRGRENARLREFLHDFPAISSTSIEGVYAAQPAQACVDGYVGGRTAGQHRPCAGSVASVCQDTERGLQLLGGGGGGEAEAVNHMM